MARRTQDSNGDAPAKVTARDAYDALPVSEDPAGVFVAGAIGNAVDLLEAKAQIQADLQQSRDFLAFAVKSGQASEDQARWVSEYLPKRTKGAGDSEEVAEEVTA